MIPLLSTKPFALAGVNCVHEITDPPLPQTVPELLNKFKLPSSTCFTCAQIMHFLRRHPIPEIYVDEKAWQFFNSTITREIGISCFYNILQDKLKLFKTDTILKWEIDFNFSFDPNQWLSAFREIRRATHFQSLGDDA